jgi:hypothetical protein
MDRLIALQERAIVGQVGSRPAKKKSTMTQQERAQLWLDQNPDLDGLNQRDAARAAGVGLATLQRAIGAISAKQEKLF